MLEVAAIKYNDIAPVFPIIRQLPEGGGSVGRGDDNAVMLPDPMRLLSRRHLMIEPDQHGIYLLTNVSASNPALLNDVPVAPGESRTLNHGDQICIGGYLLEVRITAQRKQGTRPETAANLPEDETQDPHAADINAILDKGSTRPLISDDPLGLASIRRTIRLSDLAGSGKQLLNGLDQESRSGQLAHELIKDPLSESGNPLLEEGALDPLAIFGGAEEAVEDLFGVPGDGNAEPGGATPSRPVSELHSPFSLDSLGTDRPEMASSEAGPDAPAMQSERAQGEQGDVAETENTLLIPEDFALDELLGDRSALPSSSDAPDMDMSSQHDDGHQDRGSAVSPIPAEAIEPQGFQTPSPAPEAESDPAPSGVPTQQSVAAHPVGAGAATGAGDAVNREVAALHAALLEGLELDDLPEHRKLDADFMRTLGALLRTSIDGTIRLMAARTAVKREVRANVTVISPDRNNPLKFSPDADVALMYLLGREYPGFMGAEEAVHEAFADLLSHQIGVVSGMRSALSLVLERFDPETITRNADTHGMIDNLLSMGRKARLWDAYGRYFENTREQAVDRFQEFFGAAFVDAYEENARAGGKQKREAL